MSDAAQVHLPAVREPPTFGAIVPAIVADTHQDAAERFIEFFAATIRNANTRAAYMNAVADFLAFPPVAALGSLAAVRSIHVSAYIEHVSARFAPQTVKLRLAGLRGLFDWLARHGVLETNPAAPVRGPAYSQNRGKTPILTAAEAKRLIESIETDSLVGLRDRALIATLTYSFARIGAALKMKVEDLRSRGAGWTVRLHEKGGKHHAMPCHHSLAEALHTYITAAGIGDDRKGFLFRTGRGHVATTLSQQPMTQPDAWRMIRRRAVVAGITAPIGNHTFRATGITAYLGNGGALEHAQEMAAHESPRTTKLYDRTNDEITLDEIERIAI